jgi:hypothetical protein
VKDHFGVIEEGAAWGTRFSYIYPKEELRAKLHAMHEDLSTPWTFVKMAAECRAGKIDRKAIERFVRKSHNLSDRHQMILSLFVREVESGRLRLYYKNKDAKRWVLKQGQKTNLPMSGPERKARQIKNKIIREYFPAGTQAPEPQRQLQVRIGSFGPSLRTTQRKEINTSMPNFSDVFKR